MPPRHPRHAGAPPPRARLLPQGCALAGLVRSPRAALVWAACVVRLSGQSCKQVGLGARQRWTGGVSRGAPGLAVRRMLKDRAHICVDGRAPAARSWASRWTSTWPRWRTRTRARASCARRSPGARRCRARWACSMPQVRRSAPRPARGCQASVLRARMHAGELGAARPARMGARPPQLQSERALCAVRGSSMHSAHKQRDAGRQALTGRLRAGSAGGV